MPSHTTRLGIAPACDRLMPSWPLLLGLAAFARALAVVLLLRLLLDRMDPLAALVVTVAAIALLMPHLLARPHLLALPLLVIWCGRLLAARDDGRVPPLWLAAAMALWANLHASFV